jgi:hypothetical protein
MIPAFNRSLRFLLLFILLPLLPSCVVSITQYEKTNIYGCGYDDKDLGGGVFEVVFVAQDRPMNFVKFACLYRAAELCYAHNFHYFSVTKVADMSSGDTIPNGETGQGATRERPGIKYSVQCFNQNGSGKIYDAYSILDRYNIPGTQILHTVAQRKAEALNPKPQ